MSGNPNPAQIIVGVFLSLFGTVIILLGGGCTIMFGIQLAGLVPGDLDSLAMMFLLMSLAALAVGFVCLWVGVTMFRGGGSQSDAPPQGGGEEE